MQQGDDDEFLACVDEWADLVSTLGERGLTGPCEEAYRAMVEAMVGRAREASDEEFVRRCAIAAHAIVETYGASVAQILAADAAVGVSQYTALHTLVSDASGLAQTQPRAIAQATAVSMAMAGALPAYYLRDFAATLLDASRLVQSVLSLCQYCVDTEIYQAPLREYPEAYVPHWLSLLCVPRMHALPLLLVLCSDPEQPCGAVHELPCGHG